MPNNKALTPEQVDNWLENASLKVRATDVNGLIVTLCKSHEALRAQLAEALAREWALREALQRVADLSHGSANVIALHALSYEVTP